MWSRRARTRLLPLSNPLSSLAPTHAASVPAPGAQKPCSRWPCLVHLHNAFSSSSASSSHGYGVVGDASADSTNGPSHSSPDFRPRGGYAPSSDVRISSAPNLKGSEARVSGLRSTINTTTNASTSTGGKYENVIASGHLDSTSKVGGSIGGRGKVEIVNNGSTPGGDCRLGFGYVQGSVNRATEKFGPSRFAPHQNSPFGNTHSFDAPPLAPSSGPLQDMNKATRTQVVPFIPFDMNSRNSGTASRAPMGVAGREGPAIVYGNVSNGYEQVQDVDCQGARVVNGKLHVGEQQPPNSFRNSVDMNGSRRFSETPQGHNGLSQNQMNAVQVNGSSYGEQDGRDLNPGMNAVYEYPLGAGNRGAEVIRESNMVSGDYSRQWRGQSPEVRSSTGFNGAPERILDQDRVYNRNLCEAGVVPKSEFSNRNRQSYALRAPLHEKEFRNSAKTRGGYRSDQTHNPAANYGSAGYYGASAAYTSPFGDVYQDPRLNSTHQYPRETEIRGQCFTGELDEYNRGSNNEGSRGKVPSEYQGNVGLKSQQSPSHRSHGFHNSSIYPSGFGQKGVSGALWDGQQSTGFEHGSVHSTGGVDNVGTLESSGFRDPQVTNQYAGAAQAEPLSRTFAPTGAQTGSPHVSDRYGGIATSVQALNGNQFSVEAIGVGDVQRARNVSGIEEKIDGGIRFEDKKANHFSAGPLPSQNPYSGKVPVASRAVSNSPLNNLLPQTPGSVSGGRQIIQHLPGGFFEPKKPQVNNRFEENLSINQSSRLATENAKIPTFTPLPLVNETVAPKYPIEPVRNSLVLDNLQLISQSSSQVANKGWKVGITGHSSGVIIAKDQPSNAADLSGVNFESDKVVGSNTIGASPELTPLQGTFFARLQNLPKLVLKQDILQYFDGVELEPYDLTMVYDEKYNPLYTQIRFSSLESLREAQRIVTAKGRLGGRFLKIEINTKPAVYDHPNMDPALKHYLGRMLLMMAFPKDGKFEDVQRFFDGYSYDRSSIVFLKSVYQFTPRTTSLKQPSPSLVRRVMVGFTSALEALRALREKQGDFCLNDAIELRLIQ